jgi:hypothetical protein
MTSASPPLIIKGYTIAPELFSKGFPTGGGPCTCTSRCCSGGVYVDPKERDRILEAKERVKKQMDSSQVADESQWFEEEEIEHTDFPSGRCVGTLEINEKCAFLDSMGRCSIQLASVAAGEHKWSMKPLYCVLFPIEITDRVIGFDDLLQEEATCCSIAEEFSSPLFRGCKEELTYLLGEDGYEMIERHYAALQASTGSQSIEEKQ